MLADLRLRSVFSLGVRHEHKRLFGQYENEFIQVTLSVDMESLYYLFLAELSESALNHCTRKILG